ncbi:MAG: DUF454 domain-containing protein [Alphaproteobacteria bacterium]|nr:MAG: DUF454 domain-containing protein [Alphaproteobacteria bacterium]
MLRLAFNIAGAVALLLGIAGAFLPLLPTVPLVILAAFCFARANPRVERWLVEHPHFGPHIEGWRANGAISPKAKRAALLTMMVSALICVAVLPWLWATLSVVLLAGVAFWIFTRPNR